MKHLALVLLLMPASLGAGILAGPERLAGPAPVAGMFGLQWGGVIASAGPDSLVAYYDARRRAIYVATMSGDGVPSPPRYLASGYSGLSLCWTGRAYLLGYTTDGGVTIAALGRDGTLLYPPRLLQTNANNVFRGLAWNGHHALLTFITRPEQTYFGILLDGDGAVVRSGIALPTGAGSSAPIVMASGDIFCIASLVNKSVPPAALTIPPPPSKMVSTTFVARLDDRGDRIDGAPVIIATGGGIDMWASAADAHAIAIAERDQQLRRFILDTHTLNVTELPQVPQTLSAIEVASSGGAFVAILVAGSGPGAKVTSLPFDDSVTPRSLAVTGVTPLLTGSAFTGRDLVIVCGSGDISAFLLDPTATTVTHDSMIVSVAPAAQSAPALAPGAVVWREPIGDSGTRGKIYASFHNGPRVAVSTAGNSDFLWWAPSVAFTGSIYMITWHESNDGSTSVMRRFAADGTPIDPTPAWLGTGYGPVVAFNGATFLVVFYDGKRLVARRFDRDGNPLNDLVVTDSGGSDIQIASNGEDFLVVWSVGSDYGQYPSPNLVVVVAARVSASGQVLDPTPITVAATKADEVAPRVASNGRDYVVAWNVVGLETNIVAQRVQANGSLDGPPLTVGHGAAYVAADIAVAGDPAGYWIAWDNYSAESVTLTRLDNAGALSADPLAVSGALTPALLATSTDSAVWAYTRDTDNLTTQIVMRTLGRGRGRPAGR